MGKMNNKWVILCSTAVAAVYGAGYFTTEAQAIKMNLQPQAQTVIPAKAANSSINSGNNSPAATNVNLADSNKTSGNKLNKNAAKNNQPKPKQIYKNGVFNGFGMNRRGTIEVAVTLKNDKITDVAISNWGMHYSESDSDVQSLSNEVLQRQNVQVDNVSGATYSTQAFADAVQDALNHAYNA